jgi:5-formyltetrahydrofolate cyclo-ligase
MMLEKAALRNRIRTTLLTISPTVRAAAAAQACALLKRQPVWNAAGAILFFAPLAEELDIWPLLGEALAAGKTVGLPRYSSAVDAYVACRIRNLQSDIEPGRFDIREPTSACAQLALNRQDLILVPGVAFDLAGRRLGRGRGFYDRLLAAVRGTKCGVAFDEQIVIEVPAGPQDVRVNCLLTPRRWLEVQAAAC